MLTTQAKIILETKKYKEEIEVVVGVAVDIMLLEMSATYVASMIDILQQSKDNNSTEDQNNIHTYECVGSLSSQRY